MFLPKGLNDWLWKPQVATSLYLKCKGLQLRRLNTQAHPHPKFKSVNSSYAFPDHKWSSSTSELRRAKIPRLFTCLFDLLVVCLLAWLSSCLHACLYGRLTPVNSQIKTILQPWWWRQRIPFLNVRSVTTQKSIIWAILRRQNVKGAFRFVIFAVISMKY